MVVKHGVCLRRLLDSHDQCITQWKHSVLFCPSCKAVLRTIFLTYDTPKFFLEFHSTLEVSAESPIFIHKCVITHAHGHESSAMRIRSCYDEVAMESPPSFSGHSEAPALSEDSGLIITSGSISSDSVSGWLHIASELQESDYDDKSLSLSDFQDMSERMCGDNFNTVKKGPTKLNIPAIEPPPQFQDSPIVGRVMKDEDKRHKRGETRLCSSHSSLATQPQADDSSFITQAISHDTLSASDIADMYNVPFDSDIYAIPFDVIKPLSSSSTCKSHHLYKRSRNRQLRYASSKSRGCIPHSANITTEIQVKRHSVPSTSMSNKCISAVSVSHDPEPMHMTLPEVQKYLHKLYSSSSESDTISRTIKRNSKSKSTVNNVTNNNTFKYNSLQGNLDGVSKQDVSNSDCSNNINNIRKNSKKNNSIVNDIKPKKCNREKIKVNSVSNNVDENKEDVDKRTRSKRSPVKGLSLNLKQTLCNLFGLRRNDSARNRYKNAPPPPLNRALPPLPQSSPLKQEDTPMDFATSLQKVKDYGWYWGPVSVEAAEKILSDEPDGSFIVRDSSDDHYIFTLTFKLNGMRHVRIEHDQGGFCFGSCQMFKAHTIVEFIENAVETSRSGRYLFFLNLRPVQGPMRVKLLYPVSRFKRVQSLQHMCRFVILKVVRRDLLNSLPLPRRLLDYLSAPHYYAEMLNDV